MLYYTIHFQPGVVMSGLALPASALGYDMGFMIYDLFTKVYEFLFHGLAV